MQYANMKEITDAQALEVSFDSTNTLYSVILSNSQLHFGILNLKLNVGRRGISISLQNQTLQKNFMNFGNIQQKD